MQLNDILTRLDGVRARGAGRWTARCPAHAPDRTPSLSIKEGERGLLLRCFAGCSVEELCGALNIRLADLFNDALLPIGQRPAPRPAKVDRTALAFRFELAALDLRLRAERIIEAGKSLDVATMTNEELDRVLQYAAQAHVDVERAELFEHVAGTLRMKDFTERKSRARQTRIA